MHSLKLLLVASINGFLVFAASKGLNIDSFSLLWWLFVLIGHASLVYSNKFYWSN